jgi:hypothetical protein
MKKSEKIGYCKDICVDIFRSLKEEIFPLPAIRRIAEEFCYVYPAVASAHMGFIQGITDEFKIEYSIFAAFARSSPFMTAYSVLHQDETSKEKEEEKRRFRKLKQKLRNLGKSAEAVALGYIAGNVAGYIYKYLLR